MNNVNDMTVSHNWAIRPDDQRFLNMEDLYNSVKNRRESSQVRDTALDMISVRAEDSSNDMALVGPDGESLGCMTHFAFGQLCARAKAPASYLRSLPASLAQIPLQWSLENEGRVEDRDGKILSRINGHKYVAAVTSSSYGRIWDEEVVRAVKNRLDLTQWKIPGASYAAKDPKRATTLYASDRDVFIFLVNEGTGQIEVEGEQLNRGVIIWNSEVGSATFGIKTFTYDYVCDNRIIWGQGNISEIKIKHCSGAPDRFVYRALPMLRDYASASALPMIETIKNAKNRIVGQSKKDVTEWLRKKGFTTSLANKAYDRAEEDPRGYNPRSVWGLVQGLTDAAHDVSYTDARTDIEEKAGKLLEAVAS